MTDEALFALAVEFALATGQAAMYRTRAELIRGDDSTDADRAKHWDNAARTHREALHERLREATAHTVHALPDDELPVATWQRGRVEVRAVTTDATRAVRVRYTPAQALAAGAALIACAAITDTRAGGTLADILAAFPPNPTPAAEPTAEGTAEDSGDAGRPA